MKRFLLTLGLMLALALGAEAQVFQSGSVSLTLPVISNNIGTTGWAAYSDTQYTSSTAFAISAASPTQIRNNAASVITDQKPADIVTFYNSTTQVITGRTGDTANITLDFKIRSTTGGANYFDVWFDIGGPVGQFYRRTTTLPKGNGVEQTFSSTTSVYNLGTWQANGAKVFIECALSCEIYDIRYLVVRSHKAR